MVKWTESRPDMDFYRILDPEGDIVDEMPALGPDELESFYRCIVLTRAFEEKCISLQRRGDISITSRSLGEEAVALGSAAALRPDDWVFMTYRQTAAALYWDAPLDAQFARLMGRAPETVADHLPGDGADGVNFVPMYAPLAVNVTNAVGSAMADSLADRDHVSLAYIGDGSTSEGDFHEALNFAGVFDAPAVVVCQNNQWATSVPSHTQSAAETYAQKAVAHGVPHERVDGNDPLAVYEVTREAVERAADGGGATFIECVTYRRSNHNTADEASIYRDDREADFWAERDPKTRLEAHLLDTGVLTPAAVTDIERAATERVEAALDRARSVPTTDPERMFDNHLHGDSWTERRQRAALQAEQRGGNPFDAATDVAAAVDDVSLSATRERLPDGETSETTLIDGINDALGQEMRRDDSVVLLGYDIGPMGGVFRATESLYEEFGPERVIETPLSENGIVGTAVGMAMRGYRVVPEIQFLGFFYPAFGQFMYTLAKLHKRSGGAIDVPVTVRIPYGGGVEAAEYHSESTESFLVHTPGVRVVCPSSPVDAKGLMAASIRHPDPVVFLEPKRLYRSQTEAVPETPYTVDLGSARVVETGRDVTVLTWGGMVPEAVRAATRVSADVEVLDLRSLSPLDVETILASVKKTGRCVIAHEARRTMGLGAELSALVNEHLVEHLLAPVRRATGYDVHFPGHDVEADYLPDARRIAHAVDSVVEHTY
ncbi:MULTISPECIES: alpha-ketoacid dehydrogenase subunit alpha/beta [Haloarcula]|uniref:Tungsten formylmethanofuran dehydrogenase subunit E n=1 Tax=Haloarcula pellucida TaxID=1427151 RepID=A0A830GNF3_9EURY|nr:tungsten formylmethanofuran dehydrogenase subunit E [Halomicroarcula pellucida]